MCVQPITDDGDDDDDDGHGTTHVVTDSAALGRVRRGAARYGGDSEGEPRDTGYEPRDTIYAEYYSHEHGASLPVYLPCICLHLADISLISQGSK